MHSFTLQMLFTKIWPFEKWNCWYNSDPLAWPLTIYSRTWVLNFKAWFFKHLMVLTFLEDGLSSGNDFKWQQWGWEWLQKVKRLATCLGLFDSLWKHTQTYSAFSQMVKVIACVKVTLGNHRMFKAPVLCAYIGGVWEGWGNYSDWPTSSAVCVFQLKKILSDSLLGLKSPYVGFRGWLNAEKWPLMLQGWR